MEQARWPPTFVDGFHVEESVRLMEYRKLGGTDMFVSKLSLGGGPFGQLYDPVNASSVNVIISEMLRNGVNLIDTAYWYGQGKSEEVIGQALKSIPRSSYYISTKVCRYELDYKRMFDFSAERTSRQIDQRLQRLGLPYVDIMNAHDVEFCENVDIIINETLPALLKAKEEGKTRYIGITGYCLDTLKTIIERSKVPIDIILTYSRSNLHDAGLRYHIPYFKRKNVGIINASPTSMGLLTNQGPPAWHIAPENIKNACRGAAEFCQQQNIDIAKLAVHESLNFPGVDTTLVGMDNPSYVSKNLQSAWGYLTSEERRCLNEINRKYFLPLNDENWADSALKAYKDNLQQDVSTWT